jgi:hypothetical protein
VVEPSGDSVRSLFFAVFNYLSAYTLDGQPNPDYLPGDRRWWPAAARRDAFPCPLYEGLMVSDDAGERRTCQVMRLEGNPDPSYALLRRYPERGFHWHRTAKYVDRAVSALLLAKLERTFASPTGTRGSWK